MKEQAEKLLVDLCCFLNVRVSGMAASKFEELTRLTQSALEEAREEGRNGLADEIEKRGYGPWKEIVDTVEELWTRFAPGYEGDDWLGQIIDSKIACTTIHNHSTCPDCAKLKAEGAEGLRGKVLADERKFFQSQHGKETRYTDGVCFWPSLAPLKPKTCPECGQEILK